MIWRTSSFHKRTFLALLSPSTSIGYTCSRGSLGCSLTAGRAAQALLGRDLAAGPCQKMFHPVPAGCGRACGIRQRGSTSLLTIWASPTQARCVRMVRHPSAGSGTPGMDRCLRWATRGATLGSMRHSGLFFVGCRLLR